MRWGVNPGLPPAEADLRAAGQRRACSAAEPAGSGAVGGLPLRGRRAAPSWPREFSPPSALPGLSVLRSLRSDGLRYSGDTSERREKETRSAVLPHPHDQPQMHGTDLSGVWPGF